MSGQETHKNLSTLVTTLNNNSTFEYEPYSERIETYLVPIIFFIIFVFGFVGNLLLMVVLIKEKMVKSSSYLYIFNLSLADLSVIIGTVPFVATIYTFESWPYNELVCKFSEFIRDTSHGVTILTLTAMSVDRYLAAFSNLPRDRINKYNATRGTFVLKSFSFLVVTTIWLVSAIFASPAMYYSYLMSVDIGPRGTIQICYPFPPELISWYPKTMVLSKFLVYYFVPLIIISWCYLSIAKRLFKSSISSKSISGQKARSSQRHKFRAKIVLFFVAIFLICFFPNHMFMLWFYFDPRSHELYNTFWHVWRIIAFILTFLASCLNPITLYLMSEKFRILFKNYLFNCFANQPVINGNLSDLVTTSHYAPKSDQFIPGNARSL